MARRQRFVAGAAELLMTAGHDAVHVRALGLDAADDHEVIRTANDQHRILVSADTDFGAILTVGRANRPSIVLFRHGVPRRPVEQVSMLLANLAAVTPDLEAGAIVVFHRDRIRVRRLPAG